jgi:RNA polymerase sigma-70 factor, ECF subfamily
MFAPVHRLPVASPDDEACLRVFQDELDYIHATLRRLGTHPSDVEDLVQEVFLVLRRAWPTCDLSRPIRPYLFGIAFRIAAAHRRKYRREVPLGIVEIAEVAPDADQMLESHETRRLVLAALAHIPLRRRAVLIMHDLDEVPVATIASVFKVTVFGVYARLRKARRDLAVALRRAQRTARVPSRQAA